MSGTRHERPGVYSVYDASGVTTAGRAPKVIGVAALAVKGTAGTVVTLTRYSAGVEAFGEDAAAAPGMSTLLKLLFQNGASTVEAVRVDEAGDTAAYQAAFAALADREVQVMVCDSSDLAVQKALKAAVEAASGARKERIGVIGGSGDTAAELVTRAAAINSERMVLVGPDLVRGEGTLPGVFASAALAGAIASGVIMAGRFIDQCILRRQMDLAGMRKLEHLPGVVFPDTASGENLDLIAIEILQTA